MNKSETIGTLTLALSKAQGQIKGALRDANNPFFKSKYADLESVWDACREQLSSNELAVIQLSDETDKGIIVDTILSHSSGEWISGRMFIPISSKMDAQTVGSATTYARRYSLQMIVGIAPVDDDGNAAAGRDAEKKTAQQGNKTTSTPAKPEVVEPTKARIELVNELGQLYHGNTEEMADALRYYSAFEGKDKNGNPEEKFLTMANLENPTTNEKMHKWFGSTLGRLRKDRAQSA